MEPDTGATVFRNEAVEEAAFALEELSDEIRALQPAEPAKEESYASTLDRVYDPILGATLARPRGKYPNLPKEPASPTAEQPNAESILRELVACKDVRKRMEEAVTKPKVPDWYLHQKLWGEYRRRMPLAWAAARAWLEGRNG